MTHFNNKWEAKLYHMLELGAPPFGNLINGLKVWGVCYLRPLAKEIWWLRVSETKLLFADFFATPKFASFSLTANNSLSQLSYPFSRSTNHLS
jgi:hypothetical protein